MSQLSRTTALLRGLRAPATHNPASSARRIPCVAVGAHHQTRWVSSDKSTKGQGLKGQEASFKGQMLESITQRIAREKEELRLAALERQAKGGGRNVAQTIGEQATHPTEALGQDDYS